MEERFSHLSEKRVTVEALRVYVPLFQQGETAEKSLAENSNHGARRAELLSAAALKKLAYDEMTELTYPLMRSEIQKAIRNSHLKREEDEIFHTIYYAGLGGMERGLRKFDVDKLEESATNYLFQWIMVYAKKELLNLEAPMGVPPSRFQKHKKIAAVRKKLSEILGRPASNDEILDYFHTGKADFKNYNGPKIKAVGVSQANKKITMELILEQEELEKNLNFAPLQDGADDYRTERLLATFDSVPFDETLMGTFIRSVNIFSDRAISVLKSELQHDLTNSEAEKVRDLSTQSYRSITKLWQQYLSDPSGEFKSFIEANRHEGFEVDSMIKMIDAHSDDRSTTKRRYGALFTD